MNKKEQLERNLESIDLSIIEAGINLDKTIRHADLLARVLFCILLVAAIASPYLFLKLHHII